MFFSSVSNCGSYPKVPNGDVVRKRTMSLRYACNGFYKRVGPETVVCYSDGTWSELPTCKGKSTYYYFFTVMPELKINNAVTKKQKKVKIKVFLIEKMPGSYLLMAPVWKTQMNPICHSLRCAEAFCQLNLDEYANYNFQESGTLILKERESKRVQCIWPDYTSRISCTKGKIKISPCKFTLHTLSPQWSFTSPLSLLLSFFPVIT